MQGNPLSNSILVTAFMVWLGTASSAAEGREIRFPGETWETTTAAEAGCDEEKLKAALDFAQSRKSSSIVVVQSGRILMERHTKVAQPSLRYSAMIVGENSDGQLIEDVASAQKSVVSFLVGVAIDQGLLTLDDAVHKHLGVGWSRAEQAAESAITVRHLVTMTSGLNTQLERVSAPGTQWAYNTNAYAKSLECLEAVTAKSANELTSEWLLDKVGMRDSRWVERARFEGRDVDANHYGFATSARDLARFGCLILAGGRWDDQQLVSADYVRASTSPSQELNASYGYLWWLNGQKNILRGRRQIKGPLNPSAPNDLVAAQGALGRRCYVVPSRKLVVTRLGDDPEKEGEANFDGEFWRLLMLAMP